MKKLITVFFILSILALNISAQTPKWTTYTPQNTSSMLPDNNVDYLATDQNGNIWIGTYFSGLVKFDGTNWTNYNTTNSPLPDKTITDVTIDPSGNIWLCDYGNGVYKYDGVNWTHYSTANGLSSDYVNTIIADKNGNIWIGLSVSGPNYYGLMKYNKSSWVGYTFTNTYNFFSAESIAEDLSGNIWAGTQIGLYKFNGTSWTIYTKETTGGNLCGNYIKTIAVDPSGNIWFGCEDKDPATGSWIGGGLSKFNGSTWTSNTPSNSNLKTGYVSAVAFRNNEVWVGTGFCGQVSDDLGLYKFDGTTWTNYYNDSNTFPGTCVNDLVVDKNGNLWIGSSWGLTKVDFNPTDVKETESIPTSFKLNQNYPNPFNPETVISYQLPVSGKVRLSVSDLLGREVAVLVDEVQPAGIHHSTFSSARTALSSGVYFYKLQTENFVDVKKMMIIK